VQLFKYVAPDRLDVLQNGFIRFSQASALNDPIEVAAVFRDVLRLQPLILDEQYAGREITISSTFRGVPQTPFTVSLGKGPAEVDRYIAFVSNHMREVSTAFGESIGVLSLTERPDNLLMWAHYAQQHQGMVIEFDASHSWFKQQDDDSGLGRLHKLSYSDVRPFSESMVDLTMQELFLTKSKAWEYEQEWRMLRILEDSDRKLQTTCGTVHLFSLEPACISGLILGCRTSPPFRDDVRALLTDDKRYRHVRLYRTEVDSERYRLNIFHETQQV
jgi:hypothetical protein